jgi:hypothetical protein
MSGAGKLNSNQLRQTSMGTWQTGNTSTMVNSQITDDKIYYVHSANEQMIREHAKLGGLRILVRYLQLSTQPLRNKLYSRQLAS